MIVRPAVAADLDEILRIERDSFPDDAWTREMFERELEHPDAQLFVVEVDGRIVGYAAALQLDGDDVADIHTVAVSADRRGEGHGGRLLDALIDWATGRGAASMMLEVRADNPVAQAMYRARGFDQIDVRRRYYQPADVDAIVMRREVVR